MRPPNKLSRTKPSPQISYNSLTLAGSRRDDTTLKGKLDKVLAILETRKRQLEEKSGGGGKGKEKSFVDSWTGKHDLLSDSHAFSVRLMGCTLVDQIRALQRIFNGDLDATASPPPSAVRPMRIVCLGIGIVHESRESQFQFLLLDMLREALSVSLR